MITVPADSIDCVSCVLGKLVVEYPGADPKSCALSLPGSLTFFFEVS